MKTKILSATFRCRFLCFFLFTFFCGFTNTSATATHKKATTKNSKVTHSTKKKPPYANKLLTHDTTTRSIKATRPAISTTTTNSWAPIFADTNSTISNDLVTGSLTTSSIASIGQKDTSKKPHSEEIFNQEVTTPPIRIKVLLNKYNTKAHPLFSLYAKDGVLLKLGPLSHSSQTFVLKLDKTNEKQEVLKVFIKENVFYLQNAKGKFKRVETDQIHIKPINNADDLFIDSNQYNGILSFHLNSQQSTALLINSLDLEDYVYSVLLAEGYPTWPHEMHKVQAIVSRTYAVHQILQRKSYSSDQPYDIKCTNYHQKYNGSHNYRYLRKAVDETKHQVLVYNNKVILAMFDACCGGAVPAFINGFDFTKAPYLARKTPCNFCKNFYLYSWRKNFSVSEFLEYLYHSPAIAPKLSKKKTLVDISIVKKDKAGMVQKIKLDQGKHFISISGKELWSSMNDLVRSQRFSIEKKRDRIIIEGHGYGHQIGLCQHGAKNLVDQGWSLRRILSFYYPNTKLAHLTYQTLHREF